MRTVPGQYRFQAALLLARTTVPLFRWTAAYREQHIKNFHRPDEIVLYLLLNALSKNRTPFNFEIVTKEYEHLQQAYARGKGVLVIGHHAALTLLMVRSFYDRGLDPIVVTPDNSLCVPGTRVTAGTIQPSHVFLVQLRNKLRRGKLVCAMPDRGEHHSGRTIEFETPAGPVILAPAMIEVAARCGAAVIFTEVRVEGRRLVAAIAGPAASSEDMAPAIIEDFICFVRKCTAPAASRALPSQRSADLFSRKVAMTQRKKVNP